LKGGSGSTATRASADEAIVAGKKAQRQNSSFSSAHRCLASAFAHLGRDTEAREAAACLLEADPGFTISAFIAHADKQTLCTLDLKTAAGRTPATPRRPVAGKLKETRNG